MNSADIYTAQEMRFIGSTEVWEIKEATGNFWTAWGKAHGVSIDEINAERSRQGSFGYMDLFFMFDGEKGLRLSLEPVGPDGKTLRDPQVLRKVGDDLVVSDEYTSKFYQRLKEQEQEFRERHPEDPPETHSFFLREAPSMREKVTSEPSSEGGMRNV